MSMWHWHGGWNDGWGGGDWVGMLLMMLLVWVPIVVLGFLLLRAVLGPRATPPAPSVPRDEAEEDARRAYARGEIDRERFQQVMQDLREHRAAPL